jgi:hypothetical protein
LPLLSNGDRFTNQLTLKKEKTMINLQKLSLVTLSAAILASVGGNAPAAAAQLFFNLSGNFNYWKFLPASSPPTIYDELDGGSFTGFFSIDSEEEDINPAVGEGTYELSSWPIDLLTSSGDLVGQVTSADGGGIGEILVYVYRPSPHFSAKVYSIKIEDSLMGGTSTGLGVSLLFERAAQEYLESINLIDNALPNSLPKEIVGEIRSYTGRGNDVMFMRNGVPIPGPIRGPFYTFGQVTAVSPPAAVPEPSTTVGLCLLSLGFLLKKKIAFSPKTKATVKA